MLLSTRTYQPGSSHDRLIALGLGALACLVFAGTLQARFYSDGPGLVAIAAGEPIPVRMHALYIPALVGFRGLLDGLDGLHAYTLFSAICGGLACGGVYLIGRFFGLGRGLAVAGSVLAAVSPVQWFFATTVEVHSLHFLAVVCAALVTLCAPWKRFGLALGLSALALCLAFSAHETSVLLGPGWVALCAFAAGRQGRAIGVKRCLFVVGPVLLASLVTVLFVLKAMRSAPEGANSNLELDMLLAFHGSSSWGEHLWMGVIAPLGVLGGLLFVGLGRRGMLDSAKLSLGLLILVPLGFLIWWRVSERGAYFVMCLPFLAPLSVAGLASFSWKPRTLALCLGSLLVAQATAARLLISDFDQGLDPQQRFDLARELTGGTGILLTGLSLAPPVSLALPDLEEVTFLEQVKNAIAVGMSPSDFGVDGCRFIAEVIGGSPGLSASGVYIETADELVLEMGSGEVGHPYYQALIEELPNWFHVRELSQGDWRMAELVLIQPEEARKQ